MAIRESSDSTTQILMVDHDPDFRKPFAQKLRSAGYSVRETASAAEALRQLRTTRYRLLILDLEMPDHDGFSVLKTVRSEHPHVQVLVVANDMHGVLLEAAEFLGARLTLDKGSAPRLFVETARRLLGDC